MIHQPLEDYLKDGRPRSRSGLDKALPCRGDGVYEAAGRVRCFDSGPGGPSAQRKRQTNALGGLPKGALYFRVLAGSQKRHGSDPESSRERHAHVPSVLAPCVITGACDSEGLTLRPGCSGFRSCSSNLLVPGAHLRCCCCQWSCLLVPDCLGSSDLPWIW